MTLAPPRLAEANLTAVLAPDEYTHQIARYHRALRALSHPMHNRQRSVVLVFEGWDAAGKGGAIRRVTAPLDPRAYTVHPIGPPEGEDAVRHYLYRFWRRLPEAGRLAVFDRSWYGRVLVERVEGFATEEAWRRAYGEIRDFERQLVDFGTVVLKFWLHISPEEQLRRFESRQADPAKRWKLTEEDWRNRAKWDVYAEAVDDMLAKTHTPEAPWVVVEGDDKRYARVKVLRATVEAVRSALGLKPERVYSEPGEEPPSLV